MAHPPLPSPVMPEAEADARNARNLSDPAALIAKADHRFKAGDHRAANGFYAAAARAIAQLGPHPDAERVAAMRAWLATAFEDHLLAYLARAGFGPGQRHRRFQKALDILLGRRPRDPEPHAFPQTPLSFYYPDLSHGHFFDAAGFSWRTALEARFPVMREEARALLARAVDFRPYIQAAANRPQGDVHGLLDNADWSTLFLWENGAPVEANIALAPQTYRGVFDHVPLCHIGPRAPGVMLSLLKGGAHIPPHTGMLNARLICHLPLVAPEGCNLRVGSDTIAWEEGKLIAFDDSVEHEAWNRSARDRLVLLFDVWRPEISEGEKRQINALFAAIDAYGKS